jgi:hypothetical protein
MIALIQSRSGASTSFSSFTSPQSKELNWILAYPFSSLMNIRMTVCCSDLRWQPFGTARMAGAASLLHGGWLVDLDK